MTTTYATRADLEKRYGVDEIAQREAALDVGGLDMILADTDALVNGYLAGRYIVPLSAVPANLPQVAGSIARYNLLGEAATERARNDYKDAIAWLKDVQAGRVLLQSAATEPDAAPAAVVMVSSSDAVFKRAGRP
jgi:phage gp36-like protein